MQLSPISLAITRLGGVRFSPSALFSSGEQGAWYDPSDLTTLFQDSAGTTPVTAVEQAVGLMLDKSMGLVLGSELIVNGNFSNGTTGWSATNSTLSATNNQLTVTSTANFGIGASTGFTTVIGRTYQATAQLISCSSATARIRKTDSATDFNSSIVHLVNGPATPGQTFTVYFQATATTTYIMAVTDLNPSNITIDNVSVRELPGNHAYQTTSASRPTLRARYNLLTYSEQFDNGLWVKNSGSVSANSTVAPDGTTTADTFTSTAAAATHNLQFNGLSASSQPNVNHTASVSVKAGTHNFVTLSFSSGSADAWAAVTVDLSTGTATKTGNGLNGTLVGTPTVVSQGNGWYRISLTARYASGVGTYCWVFTNSSGTPTYGSYGGETWTPAGTETVFVWGAQVVPTAVFPSNTYQRIADAATYATGAAFPPYLFFDGVDDSLLTNSVDFSTTDKMTVWAGVTKSSDAAIGAMLEAGSNAYSSAGFNIFAPRDAAAATYGFTLYQTAAASYSASTFAAPITSVVSCAFDYAGAAISDEIKPRINGVSPSLTIQAAGPAGTGNFGNYPLYIGRRSNASLPLNGNIYSLIIRGAQSTAAQISSTESWVAAKTPLGTITVPSTFTVLPAAGTPSYTATRTVLDSAGTSYSVPATVLDSTGTSYTPI